MGENCQRLLALLGLLLCLYYLVRCLGFLKYLFPRLGGAPPRAFFRSMGEWAVVTGAGDGIGKAYSFELARRGLNVVMISRTLTKLQVAAAEIEESTGREVKIVEADFTRADIYEDIQNSLQGLEIGILVNNVGMLPNTEPCRFLDGNKNDTGLVNCNVLSVVKMTRMILGQMEKRRRGLILNISSGVASYPCPLYSAYCASKHFVAVFSKALQAEYRSKGIIIQVIMPYGVSTPMTRNQKPNIITKTPDAFVRESLAYVTFGDQIFGSVAHEILGRIMKLIPLWILHSDRVQNKFVDAIGQRAKLRQKAPQQGPL
ncbi:17-beta-hydroxysteroid dehydrogenase type 3 [Ambystoma mexicanum]|uniref:17-beta-hydroxysteroid dehydrogenase type 3 n=1 Tax=Ambystoma mexicanum TaxID=8296 RepID=UPI0037E91713